MSSRCFKKNSDATHVATFGHVTTRTSRVIRNQSRNGAAINSGSCEPVQKGMIEKYGLQPVCIYKHI